MSVAVLHCCLSLALYRCLCSGEYGIYEGGPNRGIPRSPPVRSHVAQPRLSESLLSFKLLQWPMWQVLLSYCHYSVKSDRRSDSLWTDGAWPARPLPRSIRCLHVTSFRCSSVLWSHRFSWRIEATLLTTVFLGASVFPFIFEHPIRTSICLPKRKSVVFCYALACTENTLQSANDKLSSAV